MKVISGMQKTKVKELADLMSQSISMGTYKAGCALPSINRLSKVYGISRDTVFKTFLDLKERNIIDSIPGKGYYVVNRLKNVLLLLDEYSPFKYTFYNTFVNRLSLYYKVDLLFHQYNERLFNTIIRESHGRYNKYIVMNFNNDSLSSELYKINPSRLLLVDFGKFDKKDYSYICQNFDEGFYNALLKLSVHLEKYKRLVLVVPKETKHPRSSCDYFKQFCSYKKKDCLIVEGVDKLEVEVGDVYIAIRETDIVELVKKSRRTGLRCGVEFGLIAYNDTPAYEVIDNGITALSIDWEEMGRKAADFVLQGERVQLFLPTEVHLRHSV